MARKKIDAEACDISLHRAPASSIPLPDGSVDRVLSSLFFHHLDRAEKIEALRESIRILGKDGELHIADWGLPHDPLMRLAFYMVQFFDGFKSTRDHVDGKLPEIIREAGFADVKETTRFRSVFGSLSLYSARKLPRSA